MVDPAATAEVRARGRALLTDAGSSDGEVDDDRSPSAPDGTGGRPWTEVAAAALSWPGT